MKATAIDMIFDELEAAEKKHPDWPDDVVYASAILNEEAGELTQACLDMHFQPSMENYERVLKEAAQTGAMAIRFLAHALKCEIQLVQQNQNGHAEKCMDAYRIFKE